VTQKREEHTFDGSAINNGRTFPPCAELYAALPAARIIVLQHSRLQLSFLTSPSLQVFPQPGVEAQSGVESLLSGLVLPKVRARQLHPVSVSIGAKNESVSSTVQGKVVSGTVGTSPGENMDVFGSSASTRVRERPRTIESSMTIDEFDLSEE
jgi:hypothetical protein